MAACGSFEHIFEKPFESLSSWKQIKSMKNAIGNSSFTEIFDELQFKDGPIHVHPHPPSPFLQSSPSSSRSSNSSDLIGIDIPKNDNNPSRSSMSSSYCQSGHTKEYMRSNSFSSMNSENSSLCMEGLGFESFDDVEDLLRIKDICDENDDNNWHLQEEKKNHHWNKTKRLRTCIGEFPPPISCIGRSGKPWMCFKSYRENGRFILKEVRIQTQEFLHACRENGRLKLHFIQSDDEILDVEEENSEVENEENNDEREFDGKETEEENGEE